MRSGPKCYPDPEILALEAERAQLKGGQYRITGTENENRIRELTRLIAKKRARRVQEYAAGEQGGLSHNRPTWEIERRPMGRGSRSMSSRPSSCAYPSVPSSPRFCATAGRLELHGAPSLRIRAASSCSSCMTSERPSNVVAINKERPPMLW